MRDAQGVEWLTVYDAAKAVRVRQSTIYVWIQRHKVRVHKIGGRAYVSMVDVMEAEAAWRHRVTKRVALTDRAGLIDR